MPATPLLSDIDLSKPRFRDGDRVIVRVSTQLRLDQRIKIIKTVKKFANCEVRVWVVDCVRNQVNLIRAGQTENLVSLVHMEPDTKRAGILNLSMGVVEFMDGDVLEVRCRPQPAQHLLEQKAMLREWTGKDIEVKVIPDLKFL